MASALKLKNDINKLKAALKSKATPKSFIPKLKSQLEKAEADYESMKAGKKSAPKASKQVKSTLDKLKSIIKKKKYGAYRAQGVDLEKDADRPALRSGKRTSKNGNTYYEYRANRIDVKQPPKRYPKLEDGGYMAKGGEITKEDIVILGVPRSKITEWDWKSILGMAKTLDRATFILKDEKGRDVVPQVEFEWYVKEKMADGGYMADGGGTDMLKEDDMVWNAVGNKLEVYKVTKDEYYLKGFMQPSPMPFSKKKVHNYLKMGEWSLKPKMADGGTIDNSGMTPADLQNQIWNLTARIAKLGDIESRAASDEINMLMKQRKKLQSMALSLGDITMAQGGELHRNQEDKFKYGGYMAEGGVIELKSVGTYFRPSDLATSTDGTFSEDDMFYLSDIDNYEWWHGLSKEDRAKIEEHFDVDKHLINKFDTKDLDTYDKEAKEMKGGGYMAKGGALEHGLKKGDHIMVIRGNMLGIKNEITGDVVTLNIETGERKETKE